ncbi:hypothetical protein CDAR_542091 [Caerostris darwini]|uniref:Uncharacterized protein n=1 Tax=Caerostris darwini TaxID=1538125 RepID=A0AAV4W4D7_9ARAC|nr:hypothetical protein CDAR_542091 [Caerostris darwini]
MKCWWGLMKSRPDDGGLRESEPTTRDFMPDSRAPSLRHPLSSSCSLSIPLSFSVGHIRFPSGQLCVPRDVSSVRCSVPSGPSEDCRTEIKEFLEGGTCEGREGVEGERLAEKLQ